MTLKEAILTLSLAAERHAWTSSPDFYDALKLGIEALKRVKELREWHLAVAGRILPGEDEE